MAKTSQESCGDVYFWFVVYGNEKHYLKRELQKRGSIFKKL